MMEGLNDLVAWVSKKALGEDDMSVVFKAPNLEKCLPLKGGSRSRFTKFILLLFWFFDYFNFYIWYKQGLLSSVHELPLGCWQLIRVSGWYECKMPMATTHSVVDISSRFLILPRNPWKKRLTLPMTSVYFQSSDHTHRQMAGWTANSLLNHWDCYKCLVCVDLMNCSIGVGGSRICQKWIAGSVDDARILQLWCQKYCW